MILILRSSLPHERRPNGFFVFVKRSNDLYDYYMTRSEVPIQLFFDENEGRVCYKRNKMSELYEKSIRTLQFQIVNIKINILIVLIIEVIFQNKNFCCGWPIYYIIFV